MLDGEVGLPEGCDQGWEVGLRDDKRVLSTPSITGEDVVGTLVLGAEVGRLDGALVGCLMSCDPAVNWAGWKVNWPDGSLKSRATCWTFIIRNMSKRSEFIKKCKLCKLSNFQSFAFVFLSKADIKQKHHKTYILSGVQTNV